MSVDVDDLPVVCTGVHEKAMSEEEGSGTVRSPGNVWRGVIMDDGNRIEVHAMWNNSYCWQLCKHDVEGSDVLPDGINRITEINM